MGMELKNWIDQQIQNNKEQQEKQIEAEKYYWSENTTINNRTMKVAYQTEDNSFIQIEDPYKSNYKLANGYFRILTEQKVNFSLNSSMTGDVAGTDFTDILGRKYKQDIQEAGRQATVKGFSVAQVYFEDGQVKHKMIPSEQIVLCRDGDGNVFAVIRYYKRKNDQLMTDDVVEYWDDETHSTWVNKTGDEWECECNKEPHYYEVETYGEVETERIPRAWGKPPFAILWNNKRCKTDLEMIKPFIDAYDIAMSDYANNLTDFQVFYWVLKNYDGTNVNEFLRAVRETNTVKVSGDGDAHQETRELDYMSKTEFLKQLRNDIFLFSMGVDTASIEGNVTNVRIKAMYENLNMKATSFEFAVADYIEQLLWFRGIDADKTEVSINFDRSLILNEVELSTLANQSKGLISEKTRLGNEPRVKNVEEEMELMEEESNARMENVLSMGNETPTIEGDNEQETV